MESASTTDLPTSSGEKKNVRLVDVPITNQQDALQLIVTFLNLAQNFIIKVISIVCVFFHKLPVCQGLLNSFNPFF